MWGGVQKVPGHPAERKSTSPVGTYARPASDDSDFVFDPEGSLHTIKVGVAPSPRGIAHLNVAREVGIGDLAAPPDRIQWAWLYGVPVAEGYPGQPGSTSPLPSDSQYRRALAWFVALLTRQPSSVRMGAKCRGGRSTSATTRQPQPRKRAGRRRQQCRQRSVPE